MKYEYAAVNSSLLLLFFISECYFRGMNKSIDQSVEHTGNALIKVRRSSLGAKALLEHRGTPACVHITSDGPTQQGSSAVFFPGEVSERLQQSSNHKV